MSERLAVIPVRGGTLPLGGDETVVECGGRALLVGSGTREAAQELGPLATEVRCWEAGAYRPAAWAATLVERLAGDPVLVLPGSPDGRDLAPRLAAAFGWPLLAPAMAVETDQVVVIRSGGLSVETVDAPTQFVAVLQPGVRGVPSNVAAAVSDHLAPQQVDWALQSGSDAAPVREFPPDPATVDLADARRIVGAGAGLGSREAVELAQAVATALGASLGATRVVTDLGWTDVDRQIGTTGVVVDPELYVALGVAGAVHHISGLGRPTAVVAVNTDASAPMMALADLALVADAPAVVRELAHRLGITVPELTAADRG